MKENPVPDDGPQVPDPETSVKSESKQSISPFNVTFMWIENNYSKASVKINFCEEKNKTDLSKSFNKSIEGGAVANVLDCNVLVCEFKPQ